jgi:hypothetical protein
MSYGLTLTSPPASEPVTVTQLKNHLRIPSTVTNEDTTVLPMLITSARSLFEAWTGRGFVTQTYTLTLDDWANWRNYWQYYSAVGIFPSSFAVDNWLTKPLLMPVNPVQSVNSITYIDTNGNTQTLPTNEYVVDSTREPARLMLLNFPSLDYDTLPRIQISFTAGYSSIPVDLQHGILMLAADFYRQREASSEWTLREVPFGLRHLVNKYRVFEVFDYGLV